MHLKTILPLSQLAGFNSEQLRQLFNESSVEEDYVVSESKRRLLSEITNVPMPKDFVKFTNKLHCITTGLVQKKGFDLDAERVTMRVLSCLID